jgi:hypothetical protein
MITLTDKAAHYMTELHRLELTGAAFPSPPYIGGGFARDLDNGRNIRDVDIYIQGSSAPELKKHRDRHLKALGLKQNLASMYAPAPMFGLWENKEKDVQVIVTKSPPLEAIQQSFDIGLCMCALDNEGDFIASDEYWRDVRDNTLTLYVREGISTYQLGRSLDYHIPKLKHKYPYHLSKIKYATPGILHYLGKPPYMEKV